MAERILCSFESNTETWEWKQKLGVSWRFIVAKGVEHLRTCVPREAEISANYDKVLKANRHARMMHYLREKYPVIYDEILELDTTRAL